MVSPEPAKALFLLSCAKLFKACGKSRHFLHDIQKGFRKMPNQSSLIYDHNPQYFLTFWSTGLA